MYEGLHCKVEHRSGIRRPLRRRWVACWKMGVVRDIPRDEGAGTKHLTTRWEKTWRKRNNEWECNVRFVEREYRWEEFREDLFTPGAACCTGRIVDVLSIERRVPTFTLDCTDAFHQAPDEPDDVVVEPPGEYLNRLRAAGKCTSIWWKLQKQLPGNRQAGQRRVDHFTSASVDQPGPHEVRERTTVFLETQKDKWRWRCTWMTCTVAVQTHKCKSSRKTWQPLVQ